MLLHERLLALPLRLRRCRYGALALCADVGVLRLDGLLHGGLPCRFLCGRLRSACPCRFGFSGADDGRSVAAGAGSRGVTLG